MDDYKEMLRKTLFNSRMVYYESPNIIPLLKYRSSFDKIYSISGRNNLLSLMRWLDTEKIKIDDSVYFDDLEHVKNLLRRLQLEKNAIVLLAIKNEEILGRFKDLFKDLNIDVFDVYALPKVPLLYEHYSDYFVHHFKELENALDLLDDCASKQIFIEYIRAIFCTDIYRLEQLPTSSKYFDEHLVNLNRHESILNLGCSMGDTLYYYLNHYFDFDCFEAVDSDQKRIDDFFDNLRYLPDDIRRKIIVHLAEINQNTNFETLLQCSPSLITMDIEGSELIALNNLKNVLCSDQPILSISAYHKPEDLVQLPTFIKSTNDHYHLFFRKYASTFRNKFRTAELILYGIPEEKMIKKRKL